MLKSVEIVVFQWKSQWWIHQAGSVEGHSIYVGIFNFFLAFRGTNLSTSLFCIHKMEHKAFRFVQHAPILYDALDTVYRYTAIIFKTFRSEICRFGKVFHYLSTQFIYVWKKMNRVGVRVCCGNDRYALWMKATLPIPAYIHSSLTNIHNDVLSQLLPYPNIELFLESSSLTIQISDVEAFFKYFKNRTATISLMLYSFIIITIF